ncbi:GatB/YqeY domain-containing protein [Yinghuangia sp. ASG 101]|uniref:GatB/YqeY domain-containing protein n=1 Tax=Yinghuangia sp. ASG 101 TaxID=2896848 RepID=UPI001E416A93|nr:GatB/YqeY domain-containing protein [Yinghuangia sp. ASG 101]UGQ09080.1 GatB/YqeY domain-containing protein [Yinghuangia sp. ASG 101]
MSTFKSRLQNDLTEAMRAQDQLRTSTLRLTLTAVTTEEVAGKQARELSDDEVLKIVVREAKKRREAAEAFDQGGRTESAARERAEAEILAEYLPAQLDDAELSRIVADAIAETGASGPSAMGGVMKVARPRIGDRAEGGRIAAEIKRQLGS